MNTKIQLGSVSSGTMRKEDLMPVFVNELLAIDPENQVASMIWAKYSEYEEDDETYWNLEESDYDLDDLFEEFNHVCDVPYIYFGAHPGDGADYGYWIDFDAVEDDIEYDELLCVANEEEIPSDHVGLVAFKSKNEVVALYNSANGNFESMIWGV
jgi:hypothetical protein